MGQAIYYCYRCSNQLREAQFEAGKAHRIDDLVCCASCVQEALRTLPPAQAQLLQARIARKEKPAAPVLRPPSRESSRAMLLPRPAGPSRSGLRWLAIGAAVGVPLILLAVLALPGGGGKNPVKEAPVTGPKTPQPPPADVPRAESPAQAALRKARRFAQENPEDLEGQLRAYGEAAFLEDKGEAGETARKAMEAIRERQRLAAERAGVALDTEIAGPLEREDFAAALRLIEAARARMAGAAWTFSVDKRVREVRDRLGKLLEALKEKAREARAKGNRPELDDLVERARRWGVPNALADLEKFVAALPEPPPPALVLDDFEQGNRGWAFTNGQEFAGATGSFTVEPSGGRDGKGAGRLQADFTGGGAYVGIWKNLPARPDQEMKEVRLWAKTGTASHYMIRIGDSGNQCFQRKFGITPSPNWQELVIRFAGYNGAEHWGGVNDGRLHHPVKGFGIHLVRDGLSGGARKGELWIDDVQGVFEAKADR